MLKLIYGCELYKEQSRQILCVGWQAAQIIID